GEKIFVLITGVHNTTPKHLQISVSRVNNQFIIELLKYFIPESKDTKANLKWVKRVRSKEEQAQVGMKLWRCLRQCKRRCKGGIKWMK
ncbi:MAG: hypothetical protein Q8755_03240, partial [Candidatus Phytoplasma australasiaticum]|nr:hypothetical protein [Candidatus Phytoplasma australasiaticum]